MSLLLARSLVFGTSAAVLVLEILAGRLVAPYIGVTLETFTGIIGIVLLGIAIGAWLGGRVADRGRAQVLLGPLLVASGVLAMVAATVIDLVGPHMGAAGPLEIVVLTVSAFFLPVLTLSMVPPIVVKLRLRTLDETGTVVGSLSALSTIGALAGTFLTGFVLVAAFPTRALVIGVGAALVFAGIALVARATSKRDVAVAVMTTLVGATGLGLSSGPCAYQTLYFCAVVETDPTRPSGRTLWLDARPHSYVDLADPTYLDMWYARAIADVMATTSEGPIDVAYIGGGGFTLPRYVAATRSGSTATVMEIDGPLVRLVERDLGLRRSDALRVDVGDARLSLPKYGTGTFDVIVGDAFGGLSVPWHLTTREFLREIDRVLADDGIYVVNVIDYPPLAFARAEVATFRVVFPYVALIAPPTYVLGERGGNFVIVGSQRALDWTALQSRFLASNDLYVLWPDDFAQGFAGGAASLTDDFAPVDQLLSGPPPTRSR